MRMHDTAGLARRTGLSGFVRFIRTYGNGRRSAAPAAARAAKLLESHSLVPVQSRSASREICDRVCRADG